MATKHFVTDAEETVRDALEVLAWADPSLGYDRKNKCMCALLMLIHLMFLSLISFQLELQVRQWPYGNYLLLRPSCFSSTSFSDMLQQHFSTNTHQHSSTQHTTQAPTSHSSPAAAQATNPLTPNTSVTPCLPVPSAEASSPRLPSPRSSAP